MGGDVKRIVCLANSRKHGGRCIAGKELLTDGSIGAWIRPVTNEGSGEVPSWECKYVDDSEPAVLDVLEVPLLGHVPKDYQQENWELDPKRRWHRIRGLTIAEAAGCVDPVGPLWLPGHKTFNGLNDYVPLEQTKGVSDSLRLIRVTDLSLSVFAPRESYGDPTRRVQGRFGYEGLGYRLWVTDVNWEKEYRKLANGKYEIGEAYLTISLGEPNKDGNCYKLIAAVITPGGGPPWKAQLGFP